MELDEETEKARQYFVEYFRYRDSTGDKAKVSYIDNKGKINSLSMKDLADVLERKDGEGLLHLGKLLKCAVVISYYIKMNHPQRLDGKKEMIDALSAIYRTDNIIESRYFVTYQTPPKI
ncbi:MAG TPA: hypothetical protein VI894_02050 [Candidatus Nanoarchaeia archaeon]|nr:hypothetical protein [Candidatus Nanoarchaeia archaeon]